jgi:predicted membrane protein
MSLNPTLLVFLFVFTYIFSFFPIIIYLLFSSKVINNQKKKKKKKQKTDKKKEGCTYPNQNSSRVNRNKIGIDRIKIKENVIT